MNTYTHCLHHYCVYCKEMLGFDGMLAEAVGSHTTQTQETICEGLKILTTSTRFPVKPHGSIWRWDKEGDFLIEVKEHECGGMIDYGGTNE